MSHYQIAVLAGSLHIAKVHDWLGLRWRQHDARLPSSEDAAGRLAGVF